MTGRAFAALAAAACGLLAATAASAEDADYYRGGWRTSADDPNVYNFVIAGAKVHGVYCTHCSDGTTLSRVVGTFDEGTGIDFSVRHLDLSGTLVSEDRLHGRLQDGKLHITGTRGADGSAIDRLAFKDPRGPVPAPPEQLVLPPGSPNVPGTARDGQRPPPEPYVQAGPWKNDLSARDILGVWAGFKYGEGKQFFIIRNDGPVLFGIACGPCDNPYTMAVLDEFAFHGDVVSFAIQHEDWGEVPKIPFARRIAAHIGMNELRFDAHSPQVPDAEPVGASLLGPFTLEATAGNVNSVP